MHELPEKCLNPANWPARQIKVSSTLEALISPWFLYFIIDNIEKIKIMDGTIAITRINFPVIVSMEI